MAAAQVLAMAADPRIQLRDKLSRELAQAEHDARIHTRREAGRLGDVPPARALLAIADHADEVEVSIEKLIGHRQPVGLRLAHAVALAFSNARHYVFDRLIRTERSYRMTLLGLRHGLDVLRTLREVAASNHDVKLLKFCDRILVERLCLIEDAEQALAWFAEMPELALRSNARLVLTTRPNRPSLMLVVKN